MVLDWAIGTETCEDAAKNKSAYVCGGNSTCYNPINGSGYRCNCTDGYQGNPYLKDGCQGMQSTYIYPQQFSGKIKIKHLFLLCGNTFDFVSIVCMIAF
jgi:hypothetical protein